MKKHDEIIIRVDANHQIGHGHLVRCISLAHAIQPKFKVHFVIRDLPPSYVKIIEQYFRLTQIQDEESFLSLISEQQIVIFDGYQFGESIRQKVRYLNARIVYIDDFHEGFYTADLIINTAPKISKTLYQTGHDTRFALGIDYVLLRPSFLDLAKRDKITKTPGNLMICFGGADPKNLTQQCLQIALECRFFQKIHVVLGASYQANEQLIQSIADDHQRVQIHQALEEQKMSELMMDCEYALVPSSGILHEAIACRCHCLSGSYINNQSDIQKGYLELGAIEDLGNFQEARIREVLQKIPLKGKPHKLIDGYSGQRLIKKLEELIA